MKPYRLYIPLFVAASLILGLWLGFYLATRIPSNNIEFILPSASSNKLSKIINYIDENYVDTIAKDRIIDKAIRTILQDLDPHSYYISKEDFAAINEPLEGNFEGIGIEFVVREDTLYVVHTIPGGPSEKAGLQPGDKIITVEGDTVAGVGIQNSDVIGLLRGEKGTQVKLQVKRLGKTEWIPVSITRDEIPIFSVEAVLPVNDTAGFIKISRFAKTTHEEFRAAMDSLENSVPNFQHLVLDLRNNGGGFLDAAIKICEDFLEEDKLIVYTKGKSEKKREYFSKKDGRYKNIRLSILINEFSASASEIVAGAIQDHDRGNIIGRRSFGKGLVQEQLSLNDNSALRLTVARYYTPTGRCIQKPYGEEIAYDEDYQERYYSGELFHKDSILVVDSLKYTTPKGKIVYGGGGIIPDVFVGLDTTGRSEILSALLYTGVLNANGFSFANKNRQQLVDLGLSNFIDQFQVPDSVMTNMLREISYSKKAFKKLSVNQQEEITERFKSTVARHIWNSKGLYLNSLKRDEMLMEMNLKPKVTT
ncbi:MAG: S41 family peptidase [Luteibaculum sp.]